MYRINFRPRAIKGLKKASREYQLKINEAFNKLAAGQFKEINVSRLIGTKQGYRLRVGDWRALFSWSKDEKRIEIVDIFLKKGPQDYRKRLKLFRRNGKN